MEKTMTASQIEANNRSQRLFMSTMLTMGWQLAVIVLLFLFGGYKLDAHYHSSPDLTLLGLLLAVICAGFVVRKAVTDLDDSLKPIKAALAAQKEQ